MSATYVHGMACSCPQDAAIRTGTWDALAAAWLAEHPDQADQPDGWGDVDETPDEDAPTW